MTIHCKECTEVKCGGDHVYVIEMPMSAKSPNATNRGSRGYLYVGRTSNRVEDRFDSNFNPDSKIYSKSNAKKLRDIGKDNIRLMAEIHSQFNPVKKQPDDRNPETFRGHKASYAEHYLSKLLEESDYHVDSDARMAFNIEPRKKKSAR